MLITSLFISFFGWTFFSREFPAFFQRFFLSLSLSFIPSSSWWVSPFLFHLWLCLCELVQCSTWLWRNDLFSLTNISSVCFFFSPLYLCRLIDVCTWFDHFNVKNESFFHLIRFFTEHTVKFLKIIESARTHWNLVMRW